MTSRQLTDKQASFWNYYWRTDGLQTTILLKSFLTDRWHTDKNLIEMRTIDRSAFSMNHDRQTDYTSILLESYRQTDDRRTNIFLQLLQTEWRAHHPVCPEIRIVLQEMTQETRIS